jgi:hypothetical protein
LPSVVSGASTSCPPWPSTEVRNGSGAQIASTRFFDSAAGISGNGTSSSLTLLGSTPRLSSAALIATSPTPLSALTAIVLPARSAGVLIGLPFLLRISVHSLAAVSAPLSALATAFTGRPCERADISGTHPRNANCVEPETMPVTSSLPLWPIDGSTARPSALKKPFLIPR